MILSSEGKRNDLEAFKDIEDYRSLCPFDWKQSHCLEVDWKQMK